MQVCLEYREIDETDPMKDLERAIAQHSSIKNVDGEAFLSLSWLCDQRLDPHYIQMCLGQLENLLVRLGQVDAIVTCETSGIAIGAVASIQFDLPLIYARKKVPVTFDGDLVSSTTLWSPTFRSPQAFFIEKKLLADIKSVVLIDSVIASGDTLLAMINMLHKQSISIAGIFVILELVYLCGRKRIEDEYSEITMMSSVKIQEMNASNGIRFA